MVLNMPCLKYSLLSPLASALILYQSPEAAAQAPAPSSSVSTSTYTVPAEFPSSIFQSYYYGASPTQNPQPAIYDPVLDFVYPLNLTDPTTIPQNDTDPAILPLPTANVTDDQAAAAYQYAINEVHAIAAGQGTNCTKCVDSIAVLQNLSTIAPNRVPDALVDTCTTYHWESQSDCEGDFGLYTVGSIWTQVIRYGDIPGLDGRYICHYASSSTCPAPVQDPPLDTDKLFPKPKPANAVAPKPSGERVKVYHSFKDVSSSFLISS